MVTGLTGPIMAFPFGCLIAVGLLWAVRARHWLILGLGGALGTTLTYWVVLANSYPANQIAILAVLTVGAVFSFGGLVLCSLVPSEWMFVNFFAIILLVPLSAVQSAAVVRLAFLHAQSSSFQAEMYRVRDFVPVRPAFLPKGYSYDWVQAAAGDFDAPTLAQYPSVEYDYGRSDFGLDFTVTSVPRTPAFNPPVSCGSDIARWPAKAGPPCRAVGRTSQGARVYRGALPNEYSWPDSVAYYVQTGSAVVILVSEASEPAARLPLSMVLAILSSLHVDEAVSGYNDWKLGGDMWSLFSVR